MNDAKTGWYPAPGMPNPAEVERLVSVPGLQISLKAFGHALWRQLITFCLYMIMDLNESRGAYKLYCQHQDLFPSIQCDSVCFNPSISTPISDEWPGLKEASFVTWPTYSSSFEQ